MPALATWSAERVKLISFLSPIVLCFATGIIIRNLNLMPVDESITSFYRDISILYALPLLLFSSNVKDWLSQSKQTLLAFLFAIIAGSIAVSIVSVLFVDHINDVWIPAGMMAGIHSGGTPNLFAVGIALGAKDEVFTLTNSAQILWGAVHLLFLLSFAQRLYGLFLRSFDKSSSQTNEDEISYLRHDLMKIKDIFISLGLTTAIVALGVLVSYIFFGKLEATLIIVFVTTIAIMCSFNMRVRSLRGSFEIGDYCLLMFGVAVGMMSDFRSLLEEGGPYILFVALIFLITIVVQLVLCKLFKVDRDTFIITSTAAIYCPVFIPQVAQALKNRSVILGGIAVSLIGLATGNYIGIAMGYFVKLLLGN